MKNLAFIGYLFGGILLTNSIPHFIIALTGRRNMTPFGRNSSARVNFVWGLINFIGGYALTQMSDWHNKEEIKSEAWLVPYEAGGVVWTLFGLIYSISTTVAKRKENV